MSMTLGILDILTRKTSGPLSGPIRHVNAMSSNQEAPAGGSPICALKGCGWPSGGHASAGKSSRDVQRSALLSDPHKPSLHLLSCPLWYQNLWEPNWRRMEGLGGAGSVEGLLAGGRGKFFLGGRDPTKTCLLAWPPHPLNHKSPVFFRLLFCYFTIWVSSNGSRHLFQQFARG